MRLRFNKRQRIVRAVDFSRAIHGGCRVADATLVLFAVRTECADSPRLGVTIPKKTGNAVMRNRWKRLIRESFRTQHDAIPVGFDYVVRPKKGAVADWNAIRDSLPKLARRAASIK